MSYSGPFINAVFNIDSTQQQTEPTYSSVQTTNRVTIEYNGTGIHTVTNGPTPTLSLSHSYNRTEAGILTSITNKINLNGKIYDVGATSTQFSTIMEKEKALKEMFQNCPIGNLNIKCGGTIVLGVSGVRALSVSTEPSPDNITRSLGYNVDLEYYEKVDGQDGLITSCSDSWSIEPMEDYFWEDMTVTSTRNTDPATGRKDNPPGSSITIKNIPQFRLSHRVSARGAIGSGICGTSASGYFMAYREAQKWVKQRLDKPWNTSNTDGAYVGAYATPAGNLWLFNHVRSTNFSMTEGSYEITDTWLAMPTGITHLEDYTIDISSDEKFVKTVRVQGNIKGLDIAIDAKIKGDSSLTPDTTGQIKLPEATTAHKTGGSALYATDANRSTSVQSYRYQNALTAWHSGVKPALYARAAAVTNRSAGYTSNYVTNGANIANTYNRDNPTANPVYHIDRLLNVIPYSTTEGHDPKRGVITYSYEYNNKYTLMSGVISENITVTDNAPVDVIAEVFVLGRKLGPVLQALGTKTSCTKDVSIEITTMPATGIEQYFMNNAACPLHTGSTLYANIQRIVEGLKPFGVRDPSVFGSSQRGAGTGQVYVDRDTQSWNPSEGRYTRNVSWKYQQCNNNKYFLDH
jgi:hypothetical protein